MAMGFMEVKLVKAKGLQNTDIFGAIEAYVVVQYKNQEHRSSVEKGSNPVWNEKFTFKVEYPGSGGEYKLVLKIMDKDQLSADDLVGETLIHVQDLLALGLENGAYELHPRKHRVVGAEQSYCGEIEVGVTFTLKEEEALDEQELGGWKESNYYY